MKLFRVSSTKLGCLDVATAAMNPSTASELEAGALIFGTQLENPTADGAFSWDGHASGLVFGLKFFCCHERVIHSAFTSYGFKCSLRALELCVHLYKFLSYGQVTAPVDGAMVSKKTLPCGAETTMTVEC